EDLDGQAAAVVIQELNRSRAFGRLVRCAADGIQQDVRIQKVASTHNRRSCSSSREILSEARNAVIRVRISRSSRFRRSTSLSPAPSELRKSFTNAETEVSRSAAIMRARR